MTDNKKISAPPKPFTQDETIVRKFGNQVYIINVKYKQGAKEALADKWLRIIENSEAYGDLVK